MELSDSHCHLDRYPPEMLGKVLERAETKQVGIVVSMGMNLESSAATVRLAQSHQGVLAAIGIHPWNAVRPTDEIRRQLRELTKKEKVVAIGEIGLDYVRNPETKETQKELLRYELSLAQEAGLPVNIHCREAYQDIMDILRKQISPGIKGIIHGFSGDSVALKEWLALGFYVSIGIRGFVTNEMPSLPTVVRQIPLDHLLTETDSAGGGESAGPADVVSVVEKLTALRKATIEEIAVSATTNLKRLLKL